MGRMEHPPPPPHQTEQERWKREDTVRAQMRCLAEVLSEFLGDSPPEQWPVRLRTLFAERPAAPELAPARTDTPAPAMTGSNYAQRPPTFGR